MKATVHLDLGYFEKLTKWGFANVKIDFARFSDAVCEGRERFGTYVYDCLPYVGNPPTPEQAERLLSKQRFHSALRDLPRFEVRLGRLAYDCHSGRFKQKRVDGLIIADIVSLAHSRLVDAVVITSGDEDLVPAVQEARDAGIATIVYHRPCYDESGRPRTIASRELLRTCDEVRVIDLSLIDSCRLQISKGTRQRLGAA
jgi:uncharacterized LabA/DUF88 family protein